MPTARARRGTVGPWLLAVTVALCVPLAQAPDAFAVTKVSALPGSVSIISRDAAPHDIRVYVSTRDRGEKVLPVEDAVEEFPNAAEAGNDLTQMSEQMSNASTGDLTSALPQSLTEMNSASNQLKAAMAAATVVTKPTIAEVVTLQERLAALIRITIANIPGYSQAVNEAHEARAAATKALATLGSGSPQVGVAIGDAYRLEGGVAVAKAVLDTYPATLESIEQSMRDAAARAEQTLGNTALDKSIRKILKRNLDDASRFRKLLAQLLKLAESPTTQKGIVIAAGIGLTSYAFGLFGNTHSAEATEVSSKRRLIISDLGPSQLTPAPDSDCHPTVRSEEGDYDLTNAVSCPLPEQPGWLAYIFDAFLRGGFVVGSGIHVHGGSANDKITIDLPSDVDVPLVTVDAAGGNDIVTTPKTYPAWVFGGAGRDVINTGLLDDRVWGDTPGLNTALAGPDGYSDSIVSRGGADHIHAQQGNNLVLAGPGPDIVSAGDGSNVLAGGRDVDEVRNGSGPVLVVGKELYPPDVADDLVDCGTGTVKKYALLSPGTFRDGDGRPEEGLGCSGPPPVTPSLAELKQAAEGQPPAGGNWPWIG